MADVDVSFLFVMKNEDSSLSGVVTSEPGGGQARFGVNSIAHPEAVTAGFYTMTKDDAWAYARAVFVTSYWNKVEGNGIQDQTMGNKIVDLSFNIGVVEGTKITQRAVNSLYAVPLALIVDGNFGPKTLAEVNGCDPTDLLAAFIGYGKQYYQDIVFRKPQLQKYLSSWIQRLEKV